MSSLTRSWPVEKYARYVPAATQEVANAFESNKDKSEKGQWKFFSNDSAFPKMKIAVVAPMNLLVTSGELVVLESFSLLGHNKETWMKAICKGDSMLFFYKLKGDARRFRIKFASDAMQTSEENCQDFVQMISKHIPVKTVDSENESQSQASQSILMDQSQTQLASSVEYDYIPPVKNKSAGSVQLCNVTDAQLFETRSVRQIAEAVMQSSFENVPECYKSTNTSSDANIDAMIKTCLLDPNFPAFVDQVEQSLKTLITP